MIDAHNHLNDPRMLERVEEYLARMREAGVFGGLVVGCDLPSSRQAVELAGRYPEMLRASVGVHPHDSRLLDDDAVRELRELAGSPGVVAIGEIGLDFHYDHSPRDMQRAAFRRQVDLAREVGLPIIVHEREAAEEAMSIMDSTGGWAGGGMWHCCSTSAELAVEISRHFVIGIAGWITFPKADNIRDIARAVPLERMAIETDSPYITPVPFRGKPNEPAYVRLVAEYLARVKDVSVEVVDSVTTGNVMRVFSRWGDLFFCGGL